MKLTVFILELANIWTYSYYIPQKQIKLRGLVGQRTIPTEQPPPVGEVSANFSG
jgi:hypothetical protein